MFKSVRYLPILSISVFVASTFAAMVPTLAAQSPPPCQSNEVVIKDSTHSGIRVTGDNSQAFVLESRSDYEVVLKNISGLLDTTSFYIRYKNSTQTLEVRFDGTSGTTCTMTVNKRPSWKSCIIVTPGSNGAGSLTYEIYDKSCTG